MPDARGEAKVESKQGVIKIDAEMEKLAGDPVRPGVFDLRHVGHYAGGPRDERRRSAPERRHKTSWMQPPSCNLSV